jgi:hypothetical protein
MALVVVMECGRTDVVTCCIWYGSVAVAVKME